MNPPVARVYQANTRLAPPLTTSSHATMKTTATPAAGGTTIASRPATIISTLRPIDQPMDSFTMVPTDAALIAPPSTGLRGPIRSYPREREPLISALELRDNFHEITFAVGHHSFVITVSSQPGTTDYRNSSRLHLLDQAINRFARAHGNRDVRHSWRLTGTRHQFQTCSGA